MDHIEIILELIRLTATDLPEAVIARLRDASEKEAPASAARRALETILENVVIARETSKPLCQDTGTPIFYVCYPDGHSQKELTAAIRAAVACATELHYLRPNAVDGLTGVNSGDNLGGRYFPGIHFEPVEGEALTIDLLLKGGGCENVGCQYSLPDERLEAARDLEGVRRVALDAVQRAQGRGCPPGFLGIAVGGDRGTSYLASKRVFIEGADSHHPDPKIAALEQRITDEANQLGIGPMGFGGKTTLLGTRVSGLHRLPASFFVSVSYMCWAYRYHRMIIEGQDVIYI